MESGAVRGLALVSGLFIVVQLSGACATGITDTDVGDDDDGGVSTTSGAGGMPPSTTVGRTPMTSSQTGSGGATTTATTGGMGGAGTTTTSATTATTTTTTATTATTTTTTATTSTTTGGCTPVDVVSDGGYELGINTPAWQLASTNFGSPVCDLAGCGMGGGTGPRSGNFWAWFGGVSLGSEIASTSQTFVIPNGTMATLDFWLEIPACDSILDIFEVTMDNTLLYSATGGDISCGTVGYQLKTINVSSFADGGQHTLMFRGDTLAFLFTATNFMVDDVSLTACQ